MNLRTKFAFLIASIIIIPIILTVVISFIILISREQDKDAKQDREMMHWMITTLHKARKTEDFYNMTDTIPDGIDVVILDEQNRVLASSIGTIIKGAKVLPEDLLSNLSRDYPERSHTYDPSFMTGEVNAKLFLSVSQNAYAILRPFQMVRWVFFLFLALLFSSSIIYCPDRLY